MENKSRAKYVWSRIIVGGQECEAQIRLNKIHKGQRHRHQIYEGRYFALSRKGVVHLCCCRWTKKQIEQALLEAKELITALKFE